MGFFVPPTFDDEDDGRFDSFHHAEPIYVGGAVAIDVLLARSETAAVALRRVVVSPAGFDFTLTAWRRHPLPRTRRRHHFFSPFEMEEDGDAGLAPEFLRFGIQFPGGATVTNLEQWGWRGPDETEPAHGLETSGGSGGDTEFEQHFRAWPVPGAGVLAMVCEWPAFEIPETRYEIEASTFQDALARSDLVWP